MQLNRSRNKCLGNHRVTGLEVQFTLKDIKTSAESSKDDFKSFSCNEQQEVIEEKEKRLGACKKALECF